MVNRSRATRRHRRLRGIASCAKLHLSRADIRSIRHDGCERLMMMDDQGFLSHRNPIIHWSGGAKSCWAEGRERYVMKLLSYEWRTVDR